MNEITSLAVKYFDRFESISLYPGPRSRDFWLAVLGAVAFILGLVWFVREGPRAQSEVGATVVVLLADGALLWSVSRVKAFHKRAVLALANEGRGTNLQSIETAKAATLCRFLDCRTSEFLRVATDIQQLRSLGPFRTNAGVNWSERIGVDEQAKSRLMSILLCVLAVLVTLLATNPAVQDNFFAAVSDVGLWKFIAFIEFLGVSLLSLWWGMLWLMRAAVNLGMRWGVKLSASIWATERKLDYLVRDLARLHRLPPHRARVIEATPSS